MIMCYFRNFFQYEWLMDEEEIERSNDNMRAILGSHEPPPSTAVNLDHPLVKDFDLVAFCPLNKGSGEFKAEITEKTQ